MSQPVVITGIGVVCSVGIGRGEFWEALTLGASGVDETPEELRGDMGAAFAAPAMDFQVEDFLPSEKNYLDRHSELGFAAMKLALDDAKLALPSGHPDRVGLALGACWGNAGTMQTFYDRVLDKGPKFAPPILFPHAYANTTDSLLSIEYEIKGPNANFTSGMTAGADALAFAAECVRLGRADVMLAAGVDALSPFVLQGSQLAGLAGDDASGPFRDGRNGHVPGEAGVVLVVEAAESAQARGVTALAEVAGCGVGQGDGLPARIESAMRAAMSDAGADRVDAVFACANGSAELDAAEAQALKSVLGDELDSVPITALKAALGETFAAAGPAHAAAACLAAAHGLVPSTPDSDAGELLAPVSADAQEAELNAVLVNVADPGGSAMSFVLRPEPGR